MVVEIVKLQFVAGEIPCLEYALTQTIEQLDVTGQEAYSHIYKYMLEKVQVAAREHV
jgi:hypothetical protein